MEKKNNEGLTAYDITDIKECPIRLPKASSMMQARMDYEHLEPLIFEWYKNNKQALTSTPSSMPITLNNQP